MSEREITEYAVWWDADDPSHPGADIRIEHSYPNARYRLDGHAMDSDPARPPRGICRRTLTVIEGDWEVVE